MVGCGVDSMSRMAEFSISPKVFRMLAARPGFGRRGRFEKYTFDLFASEKTNKCTEFAQQGGGGVSVGDARTLQLDSGENYWVMPPISVVAMAVMMVLEAGVTATLVVPNWPDRPWHVLLRQHAKHFMHVRWNQSRPVMWDVCVRSKHHVHLVNKWDFGAFSVGGTEVELGVTVWEQRKQRAKSGNRKRKRFQPELWTQRARKRSFEAMQRRQQLLGGATSAGRGRVLRVLSLCGGCSATSLALQRL